MNFYFNDELISSEENVNLLAVLHSKGFSNKPGIAVAVNNAVVPKKDWENCELKENDKVLVISATKGG